MCSVKHFPFLFVIIVSSVVSDIPWVESEVCVITMPSTIQYCRDHGVYKLDAEVKRYWNNKINVTSVMQG